MNDGEVAIVPGAIDLWDYRTRHPDLGRDEIRCMHPTIVWRNRPKELERQAFHSRAKLRPVRAIPRDDRIKVAEFREEPFIGRKFQHIEAG
jgi:hypothetical protein